MSSSAWIRVGSRTEPRREVAPLLLDQLLVDGRPPLGAGGHQETGGRPPLGEGGRRGIYGRPPLEEGGHLVIKGTARHRHHPHGGMTGTAARAGVRR